MSGVVVSGVGMTKFGTHEETSAKDLLLQASVQALKDANFPKIDAVYVGNFMSGILNNQEVLASIIANELGLGHIPTAKVEGACASAGIAFRQAYLMIQHGVYDNVLVAGVEKMKHAPTQDVTKAINAAMDNSSSDKRAGLTFPAFFGLVANRYFHETGASKKHLAMVALKNREYAMQNSNAQFRKQTSLEEILQARLITEPLGLFDCSPATDGAAAVILSKGEKGVKVIASGQASGPTEIEYIESLTSIPAIRESARLAYSQAGLTPDDIDVVELHDCFSMTEIIAIEELGFAEKGMGWKAIEEGKTRHGGKVPINTSGGLLSRGHPIGATGLAQIIQIVLQLCSEAPNQVDGATVGLAQNLGGTGAYSTVHIFEKAGV
jgi:acetyl-CoA C-acetyltransferase